MASEAGDVVNPVFLNVVKQGVEGTQNIAKGNVVSFDLGDGQAQVAPVGANLRIDGFGVALEAGDNTSGSDGDIAIRIAIAPSIPNLPVSGSCVTWNCPSVPSIVCLKTSVSVWAVCILIGASTA